MGIKSIMMALLISAFVTGNAQEIFKSEKLTLKWQSDTLLQTPEAVCYNPSDGFLYVSNISGQNPLEKDGNGFISKMDLDGNIVELKWAEGLHAPKGMFISEGVLYISDIDHIYAIKIETAEVIRKTEITGSIFLNDIEVIDGEVYVSDSKTQNVYKVKNGEYELFVNSNDFVFPNGVLAIDGALLLGTGSSIVRLNLEDASYEEFLINTGSVDGLVQIDATTFLYTDWQGKTHIHELGKEKELILDTTPVEGWNAADIWYIQDKNLLLITNFYKNTLSCYTLN